MSFSPLCSSSTHLPNTIPPPQTDEMLSNKKEEEEDEENPEKSREEGEADSDTVQQTGEEGTKSGGDEEGGAEKRQEAAANEKPSSLPKEASYEEPVHGTAPPSSLGVRQAEQPEDETGCEESGIEADEATTNNQNNNLLGRTVSEEVAEELIKYHREDEEGDSEAPRADSEEVLEELLKPLREASTDDGENADDEDEGILNSEAENPSAGRNPADPGTSEQEIQTDLNSGILQHLQGIAVIRESRETQVKNKTKKQTQVTRHTISKN